jgi:hypothetical protein
MDYTIPNAPDMHLFNLASAKKDVSDQKMSELKQQAGALELGVKSLQWISGLDPQHQVSAYQDMRQNLKGKLPDQYLPDIRDPEVLAQIQPRMLQAGMTLLEKLQMGKTQADTEKIRQEINLKPKELALKHEETQSRLAETKSRDENAHQDRLFGIATHAQTAKEGQENIAAIAGLKEANKSLSGKPTFEQQAAIDAFTEEKGREPTKAELPVILNSAAGEKKAVTTSAGAKATRESKMILSPADRSLAEQVAAGTMAPSQLSKRSENYTSILAEAKNINPEFDAKLSDAEKQLLGNQAFRSRGMTLEIVPDLLNNVKKAGEKLKYSEVQFIGKIEQWKNGQLNDPDFIEYMTQRNDVILTLANVMRGAGATDQSQKLEEEAFRPTLAPKALDGWVNGQLKAVEPRIRQYEKATSGRDKEKPASKPAAKSSADDWSQFYGK